MIGQVISHYKILEKLGEGGMGVVYKAHDTELDRDVALKFLPGYLTSDSREKERFYHEARAASALNHPNVTTIYEIKEFQNQLYLAMEYVQGQTLKDVVGATHASPLPLSKILEIAIQVCEGLAAAHEKKIVHRDIKSANIMLTPKGQVKIMDFGLAKVQGATKLTQSGSTLGTAAYMSPEQARGEEVDQRSDIFSFGVVLYELLTSRLPFRGEHQAALMYSIVNEEPQPIARFNEKVTTEIERIVSKALAKDRDERYQHIDDMLADLRRERKNLEYARAGYATSSGTARITTVKPTTRKRRRNIIIIALVVLVSIVAIVFLFPRRSVNINPDKTFRPLKLPFTEVGGLGISGDGNWIAFSATDHDGKSGLYFMHSTSGELRTIVPTTGKALSVNVSPDGSRIAYIVYDNWTRVNSQYIIPTLGGTPVSLGPGDIGRFRPDGQRLGYIRGSGHDRLPSGMLEFWSVAVDGSDPRREFIDSLSGSEGSASFSYSPDGREVAWIRSFPEQYQEIIIHDLETGKERIITSDKKHIGEVTWLRDDKIAYTTDKGGLFNVWVTSVSGGPPVPITGETTFPPTAIKATTDGNKLLFLQSNFVSDLWLVDIVNNRSQQITFTEDFKMHARFSPDGKRIAFTFSNDNLATEHIDVMDRDGSNRKQLSPEDEVASSPKWSPNGRWITYCSRKKLEPSDSIRTYLSDPSNPSAPRYIANGYAYYWIDSTRFQILVNDTVFVTSVDRAPLTKVYDDSTFAFFTDGGKYIIYRDLRQGKDPKQRWIVDGTSPRDVQRKTARKLFKANANWFITMGNTAYWSTAIGEVWRMGIPNGKPEKIQADLHGVDNIEYFGPSWDGKEVIIGKWRYVSSMVIIENLFK